MFSNVFMYNEVKHKKWVKPAGWIMFLVVDQVGQIEYQSMLRDDTNTARPS